MLQKFTYNRINQNQLSHLVADDLFREDTKQIFDAKTGKHIGYIRQGIVREIEQAQELPEADQYIPPKEQLSLF